MELTELQEAAYPLVGKSHLGDVRLFGVNVQHKRFTAQDSMVYLGDLALSVSSNYSGYQEGEDSSASYMLTVEVEALERVDDGEPEVAATCNVTYGALYTIDKAVGEVEPTNLEAFGFTIAAVALWPYIRASIGNALREMNLLTMILPVLTQRDIVEAID